MYKNNNKKSQAYNKWYAAAVTTKTVTLKEVAEIIQRNCSLKRSDVNAVLTELPEVLKDMMQTGVRVKIDGLGSFKYGLKSIGTETVTEFNSLENIMKVRVIFQPETVVDTATRKRRKALCQGVTFMDVNKMASKAALDAAVTEATPETPSQP